jgi:hypothetical protein
MVIADVLQRVRHTLNEVFLFDRCHLPIHLTSG